MPPLKRTIGAEEDSCPDAETLCAVIERQSTDAFRAKVADHLLGCPACADLHARLLNFQKGSLPMQDAEWTQTEKRLDNWLDSFLGSAAVADRPAERADTSGRLPWWKWVPKSPIAWRLQGALGAAAVVVLGMIGAFIADRRTPLSPTIQVATRKTPARPQVGSAEPTEVFAETGGSEKQIAKPVLPTGRLGGSSARIASSKAAGSSAPAQSANLGASPRLPFHPAAVGATSQLAQASPPTGNIPSNPTDYAMRAEATTRPGQLATLPLSAPADESPGGAQVVARAQPPSAPVAQAVSNTRAFQNAKTSGPGNSGSPGVPGTTSSGRAASPFAVVSSHAATTGTEVPDGRPAYPGAIPAPPEIRLDAGTRVWITLTAVHAQSDGVSAFRGVVLLPVTQSGATLLARNTEVSGTMTVRNGKRSVEILEFLAAGARYRLRSASGEANLRMLGAGKVVEFDAGRVLETWMASVSTYEKLAGEPRSPYK